MASNGLLLGKKGIPQEVAVPSFPYAQVDGVGAPESQAFQEAIQLLYGISYAIKFSRKKAGHGPDYRVSPLEGLWWTPGSDGFDQVHRDKWHWTLMIRQPEDISEEEFSTAKEQVARKKPGLPYRGLRLERFEEGSAIQVLHVGPYSAEAESIALLARYAQEKGLTLTGKHHEIYLGDPRKARPENLKTLIRHPVRSRP